MASGKIKFDNNTGSLENNTSPDASYAGYVGNKKGLDKRFIILISLAILLLLVGIILIILANTTSCRQPDTSPSVGQSTAREDTCSQSAEAKRVQLNKFLNKVREQYHEVFPEEIAWHPEATDQMIRTKFKVHDPRPENLRKIWDKANELLQEARDLVCICCCYFTLDFHDAKSHSVENTFSFKMEMSKKRFPQKPSCELNRVPGSLSETFRKFNWED